MRRDNRHAWDPTRRPRPAGRQRLPVLIVVLVVLLGACTQTSHEDPPAPGGERDDRVASTIAAPVTTAPGHGDMFEGEPREPLPLVPPAGTVEFAWQRTEIPVPSRTDAFIELITETEAGFVAFGHGYSEEPGTAGLLMWESADGLAWSRVDGLTGVPAGFENGRVSVLPDGFVARGETFDDDAHEGSVVILHSADGRTWADVTPDIELLAGEHPFFHEDIVVGGAGAIAVGSIDFYPPEPPLLIEYEGYRIVIDHDRNSLEVLDGDGVVRYRGRPDEIYGSGGETDEGIAIFHPESGDQLFVLPWDVIEEIDGSFTDSDHGAEPEEVVVEVDSYTLTITGYEPGNPEGAAFAIHDTASGSLVAEGAVPELTEGPPPRFVAGDGAVLIAFPTWDAWWEAEHQAYESFGESFEDLYYSKPIALVSSSGESWQVVDLSAGIASNQNAYLHQGFVGPDRFVIRGSVDNRDTHRSTQVEWTSTDGVAWDLAPLPETEHFLWGVARTPSGLLGIAGEEGGAAVLYSENGIDWEPALVVAGEEGAYTFVQALAIGDLGAVIAVVSEGPYGGGDFHEDEFEQVTTTIAAGHAPTTEAPATTIVSHAEEDQGDEGHDDEGHADVEFIEPGPPRSALYVSFDGRTFYEIIDDGSLDGLWISNIQVAGDRVFVVAQNLAEQLELEQGHDDGRFEASPLVVLVGSVIE